MVDSFIGDPVGGPHRSDVRLTVLVALAQSDISISCPACGQSEPEGFDFDELESLTECSFECRHCSEQFNVAADTVWPNAFADVADRGYD